MLPLGEESGEHTDGSGSGTAGAAAAPLLPAPPPFLLPCPPWATLRGAHHPPEGPWDSGTCESWGDRARGRRDPGASLLGQVPLLAGCVGRELRPNGTWGPDFPGALPSLRPPVGGFWGGWGLAGSHTAHIWLLELPPVASVEGPLALPPPPHPRVQVGRLPTQPEATAELFCPGGALGARGRSWSWSWSGGQVAGGETLRSLRSGRSPQSRPSSPPLPGRRLQGPRHPWPRPCRPQAPAWRRRAGAGESRGGAPGGQEQTQLLPLWGWGGPCAPERGPAVGPAPRGHQGAALACVARLPAPGAAGGTWRRPSPHCVPGPGFWAWAAPTGAPSPLSERLRSLTAGPSAV